MQGTAETECLVTVVDDDESVRESLPDLLGELGFSARAFASAEELLASDALATTRCLILDIAMPGTVGSGAASGVVGARLCDTGDLHHRAGGYQPGSSPQGAGSGGVPVEAIQ